MRPPAASALALASGAAALAACRTASSPVTSSLRLPYADAGLDDRQAAAFALDRLAFGPTPEAIDRVVEMGVGTWIESQIQGDLPDADLDDRIAALQDYDKSLDYLTRHYRRAGGVSKEAIAAGYIPEGTERRSSAYREGTQRYMRDNNIRIFRDLPPVLIDAKIQRAVRSRNQLREVMADFWFNHFNVTARGGNIQTALTYDRDAIRPNVLASFRQILGATARHPGMLHYLDNSKSRAKQGTRTLVGPAQRGGGINENYGRELMELHTLGVDGGYTQRDVQEIARVFTGWTIYPYNNPQRARRTDRDLSGMRGVVREGEFLFRPDWHDAEAKTVLGHSFASGVGIEEGERALDLLAAHPSTARHLARKLAVRFVADEPPEDVIDRLAEAFTASGGDTRAVLRSLVESPEFWAAATGASGQPTKVKTPFELVISAVRATGARMERTRALASYLEKMGEPIYYREPPTGFPDHAAAWINPGLLLNRMSFGLRLALGQVRGVRIDLDALTDGQEPESAEAALRTYGAVLLPGRDLGPTVDVLEQMVRAQDVAARVDAAAQQASAEAPGSGAPEPSDPASGASAPPAPAPEIDMDAVLAPDAERDRSREPRPGETQRQARQRRRAEQQARRAAIEARRAARDGATAPRAVPAPAAAQSDDDDAPFESPEAAQFDARVSAGTVVGVLLGSPAFQRQ